MAVPMAPLSVTHPRLAEEWHPDKNGGLSPDSVTRTSQLNVWWRCPNDPSHEWQEVVAVRANGTGCPVCGR
jgi:hypothetical protein